MKYETAVKLMKDLATRNGVDVTTLKIDDTDKGLVLYNPATNEVVVSLRDGDDRPSFVG